jgi:tRNA1Val (adenine37-N6)-methyltransferase
MKVTTDACLFGAWLVNEIESEELKIKNVLDIGTGTGLLSLMYAQKNSSAIIDAMEIDEETYEQAKENAAASSFAERIQVIHSDVKRSGNEKKNVAHHQPGLLLSELPDIIKGNLSPAGTFYLLLPFKRNKEIMKILLKHDLFVSKIIFVRQSTKHNYFRLMIEGKLKQRDQAGTRIEEISIWNEQQQYTSEFKELLKDYYLKF